MRSIDRLTAVASAATAVGLVNCMQMLSLCLFSAENNQSNFVDRRNQTRSGTEPICRSGKRLSLNGVPGRPAKIAPSACAPYSLGAQHACYSISFHDWLCQVSVSNSANKHFESLDSIKHTSTAHVLLYMPWTGASTKYTQQPRQPRMTEASPVDELSTEVLPQRVRMQSRTERQVSHVSGSQAPTNVRYKSFLSRNEFFTHTW